VISNQLSVPSYEAVEFDEQHLLLVGVGDVAVTYHLDEFPIGRTDACRVKSKDNVTEDQWFTQKIMLPSLSAPFCEISHPPSAASRQAAGVRAAEMRARQTEIGAQGEPLFHSASMTSSTTTLSLISS
jgi:hypothetical protein